MGFIPIAKLLLVKTQAKRARVFGMYLRSSLRMSSARMKTKLGLTGLAWASSVAPLAVAITPRSAIAATINATLEKALIGVGILAAMLSMTLHILPFSAVEERRVYKPPSRTAIAP